ncbi:PadR family transcriptional regulator [Rhodococcus sp. Eu-32]|uniref:PadR family transcriptional regulator n=1 Tax=Rhodococcus sp. Eu-32 TaxID=1017319 RepID=UPI001FB4467D|nr:PadR family transcriptional regulator [Rhodococcus sp. Eu-32]
MENYFDMHRMPWMGMAERAQKRRAFTMWMPQDASGPEDSRPDSGHRGGPGHRGGHGRRGHGGDEHRGRADRNRGFGPGGFGPGGFGAFGPGGDFGRGRGRGGRGRRGDVRSAILLLLAESPMHGYELIQQIVARSEGAWKPSPGSIYPALSQLEDEGLVLIEKIDGRKTARLTEQGITFVDEHRAELGAPWDDVRRSVGGDALDLRGLIGQLMGAAGQVASVGTPDQVKAAGEVLADARRRLYRILAEDDADNGDAASSPTAE